MARSRKLPLVRRQTQKQRSVSFTKRRQGLFNKASELFMLCDAQIAVLVTSPSEKQPKRKMYSLGHPSVPAVLDAFLQKRPPLPLDDHAKRSSILLWKEIDSIDHQGHNNNNNNNNNNNDNNNNNNAAMRDPEKYCLDDFEGSESVEDLQKLVDALEEMVKQAKQRLDDECKYESASNNEMKNCEMRNNNEEMNYGNSNCKISNNDYHVGDGESIMNMNMNNHGNWSNNKQLIIGNNQDYANNNNNEYLHLPQDW